jgi:hypothetical protein
MMLSGHLLPFKCTKCGVELIRILQPEFNDFVICTECRGVGSYKRVIHQGHKLISGALTEKQMAHVLNEIEADEKSVIGHGHVLGSPFSQR